MSRTRQRLAIIPGYPLRRISLQLQQASVKPLEAAAALVVGDLAPVHLQKAPRSRECLADSGDIGGGGRNGEKRDAVRLGSVVAGTVELALNMRAGIGDRQFVWVPQVAPAHESSADANTVTNSDNW